MASNESLEQNNVYTEICTVLNKDKENINNYIKPDTTGTEFLSISLTLLAKENSPKEIRANLESQTGVFNFIGDTIKKNNIKTTKCLKEFLSNNEFVKATNQNPFKFITKKPSGLFDNIKPMFKKTEVKTLSKKIFISENTLMFLILAQYLPSGKSKKINQDPSNANRKILFGKWKELDKFIKEKKPFSFTDDYSSLIINKSLNNKDSLYALVVLFFLNYNKKKAAELAKKEINKLKEDSSAISRRNKKDFKEAVLSYIKDELNVQNPSFNDYVIIPPQEEGNRGQTLTISKKDINKNKKKKNPVKATRNNKPYILEDYKIPIEKFEKIFKDLTWKQPSKKLDQDNENENDKNAMASVFSNRFNNYLAELFGEDQADAMKKQISELSDSSKSSLSPTACLFFQGCNNILLGKIEGYKEYDKKRFEKESEYTNVTAILDHYGELSHSNNNYGIVSDSKFYTSGNSLSQGVRLVFENYLRTAYYSDENEKRIKDFGLYIYPSNKYSIEKDSEIKVSREKSLNIFKINVNLASLIDACYHYLINGNDTFIKKESEKLQQMLIKEKIIN